MDANALSENFADSILPLTIFFGLLAGFGMIANAYVFFVYKYKYSKCNFRTFVLCLAMIDFLSCLFVLPSEMYGHRMWFSYPASKAWLCKLKTLISGAAVFTSSFVLLLISIDRFKKVCRPLHKQMKAKTAFRLCLMIFGIGSVIVIPVPILFGIQTTNITYDGYNFEITSCQKDDLYKNSVWLTIYVASVYYSPVVAFMITTMVLYAKLIRTIFFGSFLNFEHKVIYKIRGTTNEEEISANETDNSLDDTDICHDAEEDESESKISDRQGVSESEEISKNSNSETTDTVSQNVSKQNMSAITNTNECQEINKDDANEQQPSEKDSATNTLKHCRKQTTIKMKHVDKQTTFNAQAAHKQVLGELKTVHKQNSNLSIKNKLFGKRLADKEEKRAKMRAKYITRKQNIKTRSMIMFVVTLIFNITTAIYFCIFTVAYRKEHVLQLVTTETAGIFFLCWRMYFINHVINPVVYGFLDPRFRKAIKRSSRRFINRLSKIRFTTIRRSGNIEG